MSHTDASPQSAQRPPLLARRFVLTRRIGKGGTANVYLAYDLQLAQWRAVKIMHQRFSTDEEMRERFDREAAMMAHIDDPYVVRVLDVQMGELPYMVMEYMEAGCVLDWMRAHARMPPQLALKITIDLTNALIATHALGIVHRDVKPHNLLVNRHGECKLTDYGIAKLLSEVEDEEDELALTRVGTAMGTASFMPPEQRHDASSVDERADVYAAGATLFTFLQRKAGKDLFIADPSEAQFEGMPQNLREIVVKACRYRPEDRYGTMLEFRDVLREALRGLRGVPDVPFPGPVPDLPRKPPDYLPYEQVRELRELVADGAVRTAYVPEVVAAAVDGVHPPVWLDVDAYIATPMAPPRLVGGPGEVAMGLDRPGPDFSADAPTPIGGTGLGRVVAGGATDDSYTRPTPALSNSFDAPVPTPEPDSLEDAPTIIGDWGDFDDDLSAGLLDDEVSEDAETARIDPHDPMLAAYALSDEPTVPTYFDDEEEGMSEAETVMLSQTDALTDEEPTEPTDVADTSGGEGDNTAAAAAGVTLLAVVLAVVLFLLVVLTGAVGYGMATGAAYEIDTAELSQEQAKNELEAALANEARIVELLVQKGADRSRLEKAFFEFQDATDKGPAAMTYVDVINKQHSAVTSRYGTDDAIERSWVLIDEKARTYERRQRELEQSRKGLGASLASLLGL